MVNINQIIQQHAWLRKPYKAVTLPMRAVFFLWLPYLLVNLRRMRFLLPYFYSLRPGATPWGALKPLVTFEAAEWLERFLTKDKTVFEYGSGGSTLFTAKLAGKLVSIEHDRGFYNLISTLLKRNNIYNCDYILHEPVPVEDFISYHAKDYESFSSCSGKYRGFSFENYCKAICPYQDNFFDLVFIDGRARPSCIFQALWKIKAGGFLMVDDSERGELDNVKQLLKRWDAKTFRGPKPYGLIGYAYQTTVWQKPIEGSV